MFEDCLFRSLEEVDWLGEVMMLSLLDADPVEEVAAAATTANPDFKAPPMDVV
jgi:hypothetical protein